MILAETTDEMRVRAEPGGCRGLVRSLAAEARELTAAMQRLP